MVEGSAQQNKAVEFKCLDNMTFIKGGFAPTCVDFERKLRVASVSVARDLVSSGGELQVVL